MARRKFRVKKVGYVWGQSRGRVAWWWEPAARWFGLRSRRMRVNKRGRR